MLDSIEILDLQCQEKLDLSRLGVLYTPRMELGTWIKESRIAASLNQTQLGEMLGVSKGNVSAWENERHEPSFSQMLRIHEVTGKRLSIPGLSISSAWPFETISLERVVELDHGQRKQLEAAMITALSFIEVPNGNSGEKRSAAA